MKRRSILRQAFGLVMIIMLAVFLASMQASSALAESRSSQKSFVYTFPEDDIVFPEGITFQPSTNSFFVGSTNGGAVYKGAVNPKGDRTIEPFLPAGADNRTAAIGMKVDRKGRLFIAGGATGFIWVYNTSTKALLFSKKINETGGFLNDVAIAPDGSAYFTDSRLPFLHRVFQDKKGNFQVESIDLAKSGIVYQEGNNLNGLVITANGKYLLTVQSNIGALFRLDLRTHIATQIDTGDETFTNGDGMLLNGNTLYVARNRLNTIVALKLEDNFTEGKIIGSITDPTFDFTTTMAQVGDRFLVVNSQFQRRGTSEGPILPFTVSSVRIQFD